MTPMTPIGPDRLGEVNAGRSIWAQLSEPLAEDAISWRQDGKPVQRDGRWKARFVAYTDAQSVRERLDSVVPGEWDLTLELLPSASDQDGELAYAFKARLQVLGVIREDVGQGKDYKAAATDAFKRAAVRFGIGHELYDMGQVWVEVDSDSKYARPKQDPAEVYRWQTQGPKTKTVPAVPAGAVGRARAVLDAAVAELDMEPVEELPPIEEAYGHEIAPSAKGIHASHRARAAASTNSKPAGHDEQAQEELDQLLVPNCPKCDGEMWDNRKDKRNPKAPDFKCRDKSCDGVVWPPKQPSPQSRGR